jgi:hypothetical protein
LRSALDALRERGRAAYLDVTSDLLDDPWGARDLYSEVLLGGSFSRFVIDNAVPDLSADERRRVAEGLALQRDLLAMYTSCGWFFDDVGGLETALVLRWAGRALDRIERLTGGSPREEFLDLLAGAPSSAEIYPSRSSAQSPLTAADVFEAVSHPLAHSRSALQPAADEERRRDWRRTFRRWLQGSALSAAAQAGAARVLDRLRAEEPLDLRDLERARDQFWSEVVEPAARGVVPPLRATEIGLALGYVADALAVVTALAAAGVDAPLVNRPRIAEDPS